MNPAVPIPYCGAAPAPGHVISNTDPLLIASLAGLAVLYWLGVRKQPSAPLRPRLAFWAGWSVLSLALVSPLCNLSVALFSARIAQHVLLTAVAAPLLVLGHAEWILAALPARLRAHLRAALRPLGLAMRGQLGPAAIFALVLWIWHLPAFYDATFRSTLVYWTMHVTMIGAALLFWSASFRRAESFAAVLLAVFATMLQMSLLGALLTFAARPLFAVHANTTWIWGLSPLEDQQLGGLIMWVIGGALLTLYALVVLARCMSDASSAPIRAPQTSAASHAACATDRLAQAHVSSIPSPAERAA